MPCVTAYVGRKIMGINMPRKTKKMEMTMKLNLASRNAEVMRNDVVLGGRRALMTATENTMNGIMRNPIILTVHPKPREVLLSILDTAIGITIPPIEEPDIPKPSAAALFLSKYCDKLTMAGNCKNPIVAPMRTPCTSIICQYVLHRLNIMTEKM